MLKQVQYGNILFYVTLPNSKLLSTKKCNTSFDLKTTQLIFTFFNNLTIQPSISKKIVLGIVILYIFEAENQFMMFNNNNNNFNNPKH